MRLRIYAIIGLIIYCLTLSGCASSNDIGPKREVSEYSEKTLKVEQLLELGLISDSGDIEVYTWDKDMVKFEITKIIRGTKDSADLEKKLKDFNISVSQDQAKVALKCEYKGDIKSQSDRRVDLKIYIPKKIKSIDYKIDTGNIKFLDDIKGELKGDTNMANVDINRFEGQISLKGSMGNVNIANGKISGNSSITEDMGSISVKSGFEDNGSYAFAVNIGNIDLKLPSDSHISFESVGQLEINEFPDAAYPAKMKLSSGMGKISIRRY